MLADELCAKGLEASGFMPKLFAPVLARVAKAQKYVLSSQFAAVADAVADDFGSLVKAFPFCRLPYPAVWLEVVHCERPRFFAAGVHAPKFQSRPSRVGYLCTATRPDLSAWRAHLFWNMRDALPSCNGAAMAVDFDMLRPLDRITDVPPSESRIEGMRPDVFGDIENHPGWDKSNDSVKLAMLNHTHPVAPDYGFPMFPPGLVDEDNMKEVYGLIAQLSRSDWAGEVAFLLSVIGLLNARNASETIAVKQNKLNRARQRRGQRPLFEHHILKIHTRQQRRVVDGEKEGGDHAAIRGHMVSGHWKVRQSGIFFWRPHARGDFNKGAVTKDYELTE